MKILSIQKLNNKTILNDLQFKQIWFTDISLSAFHKNWLFPDKNLLKSTVVRKNENKVHKAQKPCAQHIVLINISFSLIITLKRHIKVL